MPENVSQEFFNAVIKASLSEKKSGFQEHGVWIDWDLNNGILKGNFTIPVQKIINSSTLGCTLIAQDFLNYQGN